MFDISSLQYNAENPNLITVLYTICSAVSLGIMIAFTYGSTTHALARHNHFLQALILVTIVAATIIQAIGDSVARGLGMLGALSIIRFRTTVRDPRNIVFIFGAIAAGIACGVFGFLIALVGTVGFCITAFLLKFAAPVPKAAMRGNIEVQVSGNSETSQDTIEKELGKVTHSAKLVRQRLRGGGKKPPRSEYRYNYMLKGSNDLHSIHKTMGDIPGVTVVSIATESPNSAL